jgi:acyl carrier protein
MSPALHLPQKLIDYLNEVRAPLPQVSDPDQPLQIDSLGLIRLVAFLENDLNIKVEDDELLADNFATALSVAELIRPKMETVFAGHGQEDETFGQTESGLGTNLA